MRSYHPENLARNEYMQLATSKLKAQGFNFRFFTGTDEIDGQLYNFCFDTGWLRSGEDCILVYRPEQAKI